MLHSHVEILYGIIKTREREGKPSCTGYTVFLSLSLSFSLINMADYSYRVVIMPLSKHVLHPLPPELRISS